MLEQRDPFDYELVERLGWRSVDAMHRGMTNAEYLEWRAYTVWRNAQVELQLKAARAHG